MTPLADAPKPVRLAALKARLRRHDPGKPVDFPSVMPRRHVPDPVSTVTDIIPDAYFDTPAAFAFLAALLARAAVIRPGPILLALGAGGFDFGLPHPGALAAAGLPVERLILVRAGAAREALWALEEGARTHGLAVAAAVSAEDDIYGLLPSRRLTLACERSGTPVLVLRPHGSRAPSAARARWRVAGAPGTAASWQGAAGLPGLSQRRWTVTQERAPDASAPFEVEWNATALRFDPPAALVRRPAAAERAEPSSIRAA